MSNQVRVSGIVGASITDGPGFRYAIFVQGCSHHCPGCHNPHTHDPNGGHLQDVSEMIEAMGKDPMLSGVTLSGGEPFEQPVACAELVVRLKQLGYNIWAYTGFLYEDLLRFAEGSAGAVGAPGATGADVIAASKGTMPDGGKSAGDVQAAIRTLLENIDVLVDGPFVKSKKSLGLQYRGSSNQRVVDVPASLKDGSVVLWKKAESFPTKPPSW